MLFDDDVLGGLAYESVDDILDESELVLLMTTDVPSSNAGCCEIRAVALLGRIKTTSGGTLRRRSR